MNYPFTLRLLHMLPFVVATAGGQFSSPVSAAAYQITTAPTSTQPETQDAPSSAGSEAAAIDQSATQAVAPDDHDVNCVAKVILHEAGNQSHRGQVAVAQVIRARMKASGNTKSACNIIRQRGQFFNVDRYMPARESATWRNAVEIAIATLKGEGEDIVHGALFFHAAGHPMKGRLRLAQIENHVFYR